MKRKYWYVVLSIIALAIAAWVLVRELALVANIPESVKEITPSAMEPAQYGSPLFTDQNSAGMEEYEGEAPASPTPGPPAGTPGRTKE